MAENRDDTDENPFRANSPRNVLARARERLQLVRHWLIRHDGAAPEQRSANEPEPASRKPGKD
jgi:hypothetical protein